jgi:two-component system osmolarity sensor histidine kinase EnvZ
VATAHHARPAPLRRTARRSRCRARSKPTSAHRGRRWKCARARGFSLFWRTFFLLALLLFGSIVAWLQTFRALEYEPRAIQTAQQIASLVNLSRARWCIRTPSPASR